MAEEAGSQDDRRSGLDRHAAMFHDVLRALQKRVGHRFGLMRWLEEHEPFIALKIEDGQDAISQAYKDNVPIEQFAEIVKEQYWNYFKKGISAYDRYVEETREERTKRFDH